MLATVWLDIVFVLLFLAHVETMQPVRAGYGGMLIHADYTHSIIGMMALSAALGVMFLRRLGRRVAIVIALVSASHWVLDLLVHRPDMPVFAGNPGNLPYLGFGLWNYPRAAACAELLLVVGGAALYGHVALEVSAQAGRSSRRASLSAAMITVFGLLVLFLDYTS